MEHIRIKTVSEADFDGVVTSAGGSRIPEQGSAESADYILNEAIIELKLVKEEGFEKTERQTRLANLFRQTQPNKPVVLVNPKELNASNSRAYYRIVEGPIKTASKKASKQLKVTAERLNPTAARVFVILNVGYTLLSLDEFKEVCLKCVGNDTSSIDWVVCGGIYFYSDNFDNYVISPFEVFPINLQRPFASRDILGKAWDKFLDAMMTDAITNPAPYVNARMPVIDLKFDLDGIRYVKPAPKMPHSSFWPGGIGPRENTSGIHSCPVVALTFPSFSELEWRHFRDKMPSSARLKGTYKEWLKSCPDEGLESKPLKPFVEVEVKYREFARWSKTLNGRLQFSDINKFASEVFHQRAVTILENAKDMDQTQIVPPEYVHLIVKEIGNDEANDLASIYYVSVVPGFERSEPIVENMRLFFKYGLPLAAAYAIKRKVDYVFYTRHKLRDM
jgi:hypothetical protein